MPRESGDRARVGVVYNRLPFWALATPKIGDLSWVWKKDQHDSERQEFRELGIPKDLAVDGSQIKLEELIEDSNITVLLLDEGVKWPGSSHRLWTSTSLTTVIGLRDGHGTTAAAGWNTETHCVAHSPLGGVLKESFRIRVAWRKRPEGLHLALPPHVPSSLIHRIDPTAQVRGAVPCGDPTAARGDTWRTGVAPHGTCRA